MRLHHWTHPRKEIEFNLNDGTARVFELSEDRPENSICPGYSASERRAFGGREHFAVYKLNSDIVFNAGRKSWNLSDDAVEVEHTRPYPFFSRFSVKVSGKTEYSINYCHLGRLLYMCLDPTYDKLEQDADFFLEFVAENGNSKEWLSHVASQWRSASST